MKHVLPRTILICAGSRWSLLLAALLLYVVAAVVLPAFTSWCLPLGPSFTADEAIPLPDVFGANQMAQTFHSPAAGLAGVSLRLTAQAPADPAIVLLEPLGGGTAYSVTLAVDQTPTTYRVAWGPLADSRERDYTLRLLAPANGSSHRISADVLPVDVFTQGALFLNETPLEADLAFHLCYRPLSPLRAGETARLAFARWWAPYDQVLNRMSQYKPTWLKKPTLLALMAASGLGLLLFFMLESPLSRRRRVSVVAQQAIALFLVLVTFLAITNMLRQWEAFPAPVAAQIMTGLPLTPTASEERIVEDLLLTFASGRAVVDTPESEYVGVRWFGLGEEARPVLWMHPPSSVSYRVTVPPEGALTFAPALHPQVWLPEYGDGVLFSVWANDGQRAETIFYQVVDAKNIPEDRRWHDTRVDLGLYAGREITLTFMTQPMADNAWDWAGWSAPALVVPLP